MLKHFFFAMSLASLTSAADLAPADLYKQHCAVCHDAPAGDSRAPAVAAFRLLSPENVARTLDSGAMKQQAAALSTTEKRSLAEFLTAKTLGGGPAAATDTCPSPSAPFALDGPSWNGWSAEPTNTRFQATERAGIRPQDVPRLKLKWAFAFPDAFQASGQPTVVGGRVFVGSVNTKVYSLDARSGCRYWSFSADAAVRTAISVAAVTTDRARLLAFFGDLRGNAYAVDATSGELVWKAHMDEHPNARIVGAPTYYAGRVFVPVTAAEEGLAPDPKFECCSGRGALVALDAATGKTVWKTYTIDEVPQVVGSTPAGTRVWGPSGASIWSAPTIDAEKKLVYVGTGDNFSSPATSRSDAMVAFDMETGKILWVQQVTQGDVWNNACISAQKANCPPGAGPDHDFGSSPLLVRLPDGKRVLLAGQKSGVAWGFDPDQQGKVLWQTRVGQGGVVGGIQFGPATDGKNLYVAVSDLRFAQETVEPGQPRAVDPKQGGGLYALDVQTGKKVWTAPPAPCDERPNCSPAQSAAVTVIPGVVFSGSVDGHLRAYASADGKVVWDFDTVREYATVGGGTAKGGSLNGPGPTLAGGMLFVDSGYRGGLPGNVLLAFSIDGK